MSAWPASSRMTSIASPDSARWVQNVWRRTCGDRRSSGSSASCAWRTTIRVTSRTASGAGERPVLGSETSSCSWAQVGRALTQTAIASSASCSSGNRAAAAALAVLDGDPPRGRAGDRAAQPPVARVSALVDVGEQERARLGAAQARGAEHVQQREVAVDAELGGERA
jgi:hypothetical protein